MRYINYNSKRGLVNYLADFILKTINSYGDYDSIIEVTNIGKFIIVNGLTSYPDVLNFNEIGDQILKENPDYGELKLQNLNFLDTINYGVELELPEEMWFTFHNTSRPSFRPNVSTILSNTPNLNSIDGDVVEIDFDESSVTEKVFRHLPLNVTSEFPYGYSLKSGRLQYYYSEYVFLNIFNIIKSKNLQFKFSTKINSNEDFDIKVISDSCYPSNVIESLILDVFDFDIDNFQHLLTNYDILEDIKNPLDSKPWLFKDKVNDGSVIIW
jgi:hypothetical protein